MRLLLVLLALAPLGVFFVDRQAGINRAESAIAENKRDLAMLFKAVKIGVEARGYEVLPLQQEQEWETMDIYVVNPSGTFATNPRFMPNAKALGARAASNLGAVLSGKDRTEIVEDYRGEPVISAAGMVTVNGKQKVLLVEIDVAEAIGVSPPDYRDEIFTLFLFVVGVVWVLFQPKASVQESLLSNGGDSEAIAGAFFDNCNASILVDGDGEIVRVNARMAEAFGYRINELLGLSIDTLLPEDVREEHLGRLGEYIRQPESNRKPLAETGVTGLHKDGRVLTLQLSRFPVSVWKGVTETVYGGAIVRNVK